MKPEASVRWLACPDVRSTYSDDGAVLLDLGKGRCYSLNRVAAQIWKAVEVCPEGVGPDAIVEELKTHFVVSEEELRADVEECLLRLQSSGLVTRVRAEGFNTATAGC